MNDDGRRHFANSEELREHVARSTGRVCLLGFSGKDSIAAWVALRPHFTRIIPYHLYSVPGLRLIDESMKHYEDAIGTPILRYPHPSLLRKLRNLVFQPPERCAAIEAADLPKIDYADIHNAIRKDANAPNALAANGARTADSPGRFTGIKKHGAVNYQKRYFFPVYDWRLADVERAIIGSGIALSDEYRLFGRSFDGLDFRFLKPLRDHYPDDFQRVLDWFPLADLELFRRLDHGQHL